MSDSEQARLSNPGDREAWKELANTPHEDLSDEQVTSKIKLSMKRKYSAPEWVLVFELADPDGRRADAIAVNTFPSRNFKVLGFEFKASRSDWLAEKREGAKADYFVRAVDEWYVVAGRRGIVKEKELPEGWGLLELKDNRDDQLWKLEESNLTEYQQGEPDRPFWGRLLQKAVGEDSNFTTEDLREARQRGYQDAIDEGVQKRSDRELERLEQKAESYDELRDEGFDFLSYSGRLSDEKVERLNLAYDLIRLIGSGSHRTLVGQVDYLRDSVEQRAEDIDESLEEFQDGVEKIHELVEDEGGDGQ